MEQENDLENFDFAQLLRGRMKERGLNLKKLSEISAIAVKHLESLASGNFHNLPATPYFRGYILRLGQILDFDGESWWAKLKEEKSVENSAASDEPSKNRFVKAPSAKLLWAAAAFLIIILFLDFGLTRISGKPVIKITNPPGNPATVNVNQIAIAGNLENGSELYLNGEFVNLGKDGSWSKTLLLEPGTNSFELKAKKFLGGETKIVEQIIYEPAVSATSSNL